MDEDTSTLPHTDNPDRSSEDPRENTEPLWLNITETDQELQGSVNACVEHWHAASPDAWKRMLALFAVSGIFLVARSTYVQYDAKRRTVCFLYLP